MTGVALESFYGFTFCTKELAMQKFSSIPPRSEGRSHKVYKRNGELSFVVRFSGTEVSFMQKIL